MVSPEFEAGIKWAPDDPQWGQSYDPWGAQGAKTINWSFNWEDTPMWEGEANRNWWTAPNLTGLAHELGHAYDDTVRNWSRFGPDAFDEEARKATEMVAMGYENASRYSFYSRVPGYQWVGPRPAYGWTDTDNSRNHQDVGWGAGLRPWVIPLDW